MRGVGFEPTRFTAASLKDASLTAHSSSLVDFSTIYTLDAALSPVLLLTFLLK